MLLRIASRGRGAGRRRRSRSSAQPGEAVSGRVGERQGAAADRAAEEPRGAGAPRRPSRRGARTARERRAGASRPRRSRAGSRASAASTSPRSRGTGPDGPDRRRGRRARAAGRARGARGRRGAGRRGRAACRSRASASTIARRLTRGVAGAGLPAPGLRRHDACERARRGAARAPPDVRVTRHRPAHEGLRARRSCAIREVNVPVHGGRAAPSSRARTSASPSRRRRGSSCRSSTRAERLSLAEIAAVRADLVDRARERKLQHGGPRGRHVHDLEPRHVRRRGSSSPCSTRRRRRSSPSARPRTGPSRATASCVVRPMMTMTLTVDHRAVDGAPAAEFLADGQGDPRGARASRSEMRPVMIRRGGQQDVPFMRDMLRHAYYWRWASPSSRSRPSAATSTAGAGRATTALVAHRGLPAASAPRGTGSSRPPSPATASSTSRRPS